MEKQPIKRNDSIIEDINIMSSASANPEYIDSDTHSIIFCINPGDPPFKAGEKVTYELVQGDNGQYYATNLKLADSEQTEIHLSLTE
ncbi:hypothetical protein [Pseudomonas sp. FP1742]|uniref:hypothetical protein n=1 Tax=Pseudomonas sp. FP1742 TaxID=2954079 RepID=UPI00273656EA|nr:hypothetical protein [Pseudomonas sp. FP1742]WLG50436.1 hypothetical protein PSH64_27720 [Pseudomonas sp. FP1742]